MNTRINDSAGYRYPGLVQQSSGLPFDTISTYMQEMREIPLLDMEEEKLLGEEMENCYDGILSLLCEYEQAGGKNTTGLAIFRQQLESAHNTGKGNSEIKNRDYQLFCGLEKKIDACRKPNGEDRCSYFNKVDETYHELFELSCYGISRGYIRAAGKQLSEHLKWRIDSNPAEKDLLMPSLTSLKRYLRQEEGFVERFICQNLRLVAKQANHFHHQLHFRLSGMDESDLIQQGNLGLMKAVDKWDYRMGYRFATYASWWIRQSIDRGVANQSKTIRFPVHMLETQRQYRHGYFTLLNELGREPRPEEVADQINMPRDKLDKITLAPQKKFSLSQPMRNDEDSQEFGNTLIDEQSPDPEELCIESNLSEIFSRLFFSHLSAREEKIICMRYGIREKRSFTLQEIGDTLELTRERIRQVEGTAMKKLRGSAVKKKLRGRPIDSRTFL